MLTLLPHTVKRYRVPSSTEKWRSKLSSRRIGTHPLDSDWYFDELLAHYKGELCRGYCVRVALMCLLKEISLSEGVCGAYYPHHREKSLIIVTKLGRLTVDYIQARRHFQFIDDFLTDYPHLSEVEVPYELSAVQQVFDYNHERKLVDILDVLLHLNTKDNTYSFRHSLVDLPYETFCRLAEKLTDEEIATLYLNPSLPHLPSRTKTVALSHVLAVRGQWTMLEQVLADYPSYLFILLYDQRHEDEVQKRIVELLSTSDFSDDSGTLSPLLSEEVLVYIRLNTVLSDETKARLLGTGSRSCMPFQIDPRCSY